MLKVTICLALLGYVSLDSDVMSLRPEITLTNEGFNASISNIGCEKASFFGNIKGGKKFIVNLTKPNVTKWMFSSDMIKVQNGDKIFLRFNCKRNGQIYSSKVYKLYYSNGM